MDQACFAGSDGGRILTEEKRYDVFLSHNSDDKPLVEELALRLQDEAELNPWLDAWHIPGGTQWEADTGEEVAEAVHELIKRPGLQFRWAVVGVGKQGPHSVDMGASFRGRSGLDGA